MNKFAMIASVAIVVVVVFVFVWLRPYAEERLEIIMGTVCSVTIIEKDTTLREKAFADAFRQMRIVEKTLSVFNETSELSIVNKEAAEKEVVVSEDLYFVLDGGKKVSLPFERGI